MDQKTKWHLMYVEAKKYYATCGNLLVPYNYKTSYGILLGRWINEIRNLYKKGKLLPEKIALLNEIDMVWDISEYKWNIMYKHAKDYYDANNDLLVEEAFVTEDGLELGLWIVRQRQIYLKKVAGTLTPEQVNKLNAIEMVWTDVVIKRWQKRFKEAKNFFDANGFLPTTNGFLNTYPELYKWLRCQKNLYRQHKLSDEKIAALKSINFILEPLANAQIITDYLNDLFITNNIYIDTALNKKELEHISLQELKSKISYLQSRNIAPVDATGKLIDIFRMSSVAIAASSKYGVTLEYIISNFSQEKAQNHH